MTDKNQKEALIEQGKELGLNIHPNTSLENMVQMVNQGLIYKHHNAPDAPVEQVVHKDKNMARREAMRLIRVRVANMDPTKKKASGQIFAFSNSVVGTIKKFVPFDLEEGFHIPQVLLEVIKDTKYRVTKYKQVMKAGRMEEVPYSVSLPSFQVEILPPLTGAELEAIKQRQLAQQTTESA